MIIGMNEPPVATFVGVTYAGWKTRQQNLQRNVLDDGRLNAQFSVVDGWTEGGVVEKLPLPRRARGLLRSTIQSRSLATLPRPDIVWTSAPEMLLPYAPAFVGPWKRPLVVELDWTASQREGMAWWYFARPPKTGRSLEMALARERWCFANVSLFTPMSNWAAEGLRTVGVPDEKIHVIHPGLDLDEWVFDRQRLPNEGPLRLLFVGGDFVRKGGDLLLAAIRELPDRVIADVVTRDEVTPTPGVAVHRCEPNSDALKRLYASADLFVMPTQADCFGHAVVEAMASGLPAIVGDVGGVADIVDHEVNGWRIRPNIRGLREALEEALEQRSRLDEMRTAARRTAEESFDGRRNDQRLVDLMMALVEQHGRRHDGRASGGAL